MKQISINEFEFTIPTKYSELTQKQLIAVGKVIADNTPNNQLTALYCLLGLNRWTWKTRKQWKLVLTMDAEWLHTLLTNVDLLGWIWSKPEISNYPIKSFWHKGIKYHGPSGNILNTPKGKVKTGDIYKCNKDIEYIEVASSIASRSGKCGSVK